MTCARGGGRCCDLCPGGEGGVVTCAQGGGVVTCVQRGRGCCDLCPGGGGCCDLCPGGGRCDQVPGSILPPPRSVTE